MTGPAGVSSTTSASPVDDQIGRVGRIALAAQILPGSNPTRSLINASSFSFDGSISAKNGTRRSSSNSCFRLISSLLGFVLPLRFLHSAATSKDISESVALQLGDTALLLQFAAAHHQDAIEIAREARAVQHPDEAAAGKFLSQPVADLGLGLTVERRGRLVEDQQVGTLQHGAGDRGPLPLRQDKREPPVPTL